MTATRTPGRLSALLGAVFVTFLWSTSWVLIKAGIAADLPPLPFAGLRYAVAALGPPPSALGPVPPPALSPEWEEAIRKAYHTAPTDPDKSGLVPTLTAGKNALPRSSFGQVLDPTTGTYKSCPDFPVFQVRAGCES